MDVNLGTLLMVLQMQNQASAELLQVEADLAKVEKAAMMTAYQLTLLGRGLREVGVMATAVFTVPIVGAAEAVIKFGGEFETQMTRVQTLAGATKEEVDSLRQSVLDLGPATGVGPAKLAEGLFVLESYGLRGAEAMDTLTVAAKMTATGMGTTEQSARALTGILFSYKDQNITAAQAGDILTKAVQLGNMKINELVPAIARVNPVAASMGIKFQDVAASIATFTHAGVDSAMAATGLRGILSSILKDSTQTEKGFQALAKATGDNTITMANFRKEIDENGFTAAMIHLSENVTKAGEAGVNAFEKIIPNVRAMTAALAVYKLNGGMVTGILDQMNDATGTLDRSFTSTLPTWNSLWNQLEASIEKLWITLSDSLLPKFKEFVQVTKEDIIPLLTALVRWFNELPAPVQYLIIGITGLVAILGPLAVVLGEVIMAFGNISRAMPMLITMFTGTGTAAKSAAVGTEALNAANATTTTSTGKLAEYLGRNVNQLTALGWAVHLAGAAFAGWELGRLIAQVFDLDQKVADLVSNMRNLPGLIEQTEGAKQVVINKAIANHASPLISYTDAIAYNTKVLEINKQSVTDWNRVSNSQLVSVRNLKDSVISAAVAHQTLIDAVNSLSSAQKAAIDAGKREKLNPKQVLDEIQATAPELATGLTTEVIALYEKQVAPALAKAAKEASEYSKAMEQIRLASIPLSDDQKAQINQLEELDARVGHHVISLKAMAEATNSSEIQVRLFLETQKKQLDVEKELAKVRSIEAGAGAIDAHTIGGAIGAVPALSDLSVPAMETIFDKLRKVERTNVPTGPLKGFVLEKEINKPVDSYTKSLTLLTTEFLRLGQVSGGTFGKMISDIGRTFSVLQVANKMTKEWGDTFANSQLRDKDKTSVGGAFGAFSVLFSGDSSSTTQKAAAAIAVVGAAISGVNNVLAATASHATTAGNALGGAMAGAEAGAIGGPWGMAIGAAAGLVVGLIRGKPAWAQAADEVAKDFGVKISDTLAKTIASEASQFGGSRQASAINSLAAIIKEAGGLNDKNLDQMTARLHDVFSMIETHQMTIAQGTKVLDENFADFAKAATDADGRISKSLKDIIQLDSQFGTQSKEITEYLKGQATSAMEGFIDVAAAYTTQILAAKSAADSADTALTGGIKGLADGMGKAGTYTKGVSKEIATLQAQIYDLEHKASPLTHTQMDTLANDKDKLKTLQDEWDKLTDSQKAAGDNLDQMAAAYGQTLDDIGVQAVAVFGAAIASGMSWADALAKIAPSLVDLKDSYDALGLSVDNVALNALMMQSVILKNNPQLIKGISGLSQEFIALDNMGLMNQSTFEAMERTGAQMYTRLQGEVAKTGGTTKDALLPMQDYLHKAASEAALLHTPLDANTQLMIDQSKELGIWQETKPTAIENMTTAMETLIGKVGTLIDTLSGIPPPVIPPPVFQGGPAAWTPPHGDPGTDPIAMAGGGDFLVSKPTLFLAGEAGPERARFSGANRNSFGNSNETPQVIITKTYLDGRKIAEALTKVTA